MLAIERKTCQGSREATPEWPMKPVYIRQQETVSSDSQLCRKVLDL